MESELIQLDRQVRSAAASLRSTVRSLRTAEPRELLFPSLLFREETFALLEEYAHKDPLAAALYRWCRWLQRVQARWPAEVRVNAAWRRERHAFDRPESGEFTVRALLLRALDTQGPLRQAWLHAYQERSSKYQSELFRYWEEGAALEESLPTPACTFSTAQGAARLVLDATRDCLGALEVRDLSELFTAALGNPHGLDVWPSRISARTLSDWFRDAPWFKGLSFDTGAFAPALAPASFFRALRRLGASWADALIPRGVPFALAHDISGDRRLASGALFGLIPFEREFARRRFGVGRERIADYQRGVGAMAVIETRALALRVLCQPSLSAGAGHFRETFAELAHLTWGFEIDPTWAGLLFRPRPDDPVRFAALLRAVQRSAELRDAYDEDWFRNPRAVEQLRAETTNVPESEPSTVDLTALVPLVKQTFAEVL